MQTFLKVTLLSEISDNSGTKLNEALITNDHDQRRLSRHKFPTQYKPTHKYWNQWIQYLKSKYYVYHSYQLQNKYQLGKWIKPVQYHTTTHRYYYFPTLKESYDTKLQKKYQCKKLTYNKCEIVQNTEQKSPVFLLTQYQSIIINQDLSETVYTIILNEKNNIQQFQKLFRNNTKIQTTSDKAYCYRLSRLFHYPH